MLAPSLADGTQNTKREPAVSRQPDQRPEPDDGKYRVHGLVEIAFILRTIMKSGGLVTAYFGRGTDFIMTAVLAVDCDNDYVILDAGSDAALNERLLREQHLNVVSSQDGVKIEFESQGIEATSFEGRLAFRIPFPDSLIKLQRREFYRLSTPLLNPLKCRIPIAKGIVAEAVVGDISLGGVSLIGEDPRLPLEPGAVYENCRIQLSDLGVIETKLVVRNSFPMTLRNGTVSKRTGCAFLDMPPQQQALIQRYITRLERDRRAKLTEPRL